MFWYEVLMSRHRVASCAKTKSCCCSSDQLEPDLFLFHSYCCLYLVHWIPTPTLFGVSCRCNLLVKMKREEKKPSQKKPTSKMLVSQHYFHALQNRTSLVCMSSRASRAAVWIQNFHPSLSRVILQEVYRDSCDM